MKYTYLILICLSSYINGQHPLMSTLDSNDFPSFQAVADNQLRAWNDANAWVGGVVPTDNASVMISENAKVVITSELAARTLFIGPKGFFRIGTPNYRVIDGKRAELIFISENEPIDKIWDYNQVSRGLISMGEIKVYGKIKTHKLAFAQDILAGQSSITFSNATVPADWEVGDELVLPGTSFERNQSFEDEVLVIAGITGNTIELITPIQFDHIRLSADQSLHLAHLNRNVIFRSESTDIPTQRRAHLMFMNANVIIEHAAVVGLGRTDKSKPLDEITVDLNTGNVTSNGLRNNIRGRYAVHFHKNGYGTDVNNPPSKIFGCVVRNTQGWGFVNHSSHVHFEQNVAYDFVGSGFVTESGDELGNFYDNIAIRGTGNGEYRTVRIVFSNANRPQALSDFAFSGDGFWFQGPAVRAVNNVAANCNGAGMFWFSIGSIDIETNQMIGLDSSIAKQTYASFNLNNWLARTWLHDPSKVLTADLPILECSNFFGYANLSGFRIRMNNSGSSNAFFNADFGGGDVFGYRAQIKPAIGTSSTNANRLTQTSQRRQFRFYKYNNK